MKRVAFVVLLVLLFMATGFKIEARMMTNQEILSYPKFVPILNEDRNKTQESLTSELAKHYYTNDDDTLYSLTGFLDSVDFNTGKIVLMSRWAPAKVVYIYFDTKDTEFINQLKKVANSRNSDGAKSAIQVGAFFTAEYEEDLGFKAIAKYVRVLIGGK